MRFDLHIHSNHSTDSNMTVDSILKQAVSKGLDGIAICDHNTVEGSLLGIKRSTELNLPLIVLPGMEISTAQGHLIVLGVRENIPSNLSYLETIRIARQKGGVAIAVHPFKAGGIGCNAKDADAIETLNSRCIFGENGKAEKIAQEFGKPEVGGSDSHMLATIGLGYTNIDAEPDEEAILSAIRAGRTSSSGKIVPVYILFIHTIRELLRRVYRLGKKIYSKIFQ